VEPVGTKVLCGDNQPVHGGVDEAAVDRTGAAAGAAVDQQVRVGGRGPACVPGRQPCAQLRGGEPVQGPDAAAGEQRARGEVDVIQHQRADAGRAQRVHPGQQHDEPLGGAGQAAEQPCAQAVLERQHRWRLDSAAGQRRGRVGEQHPAGLERAEQRPHRRQGQQPGRPGQRGQGGGQVLGGDLPQRLIPGGPGGQRGLQDAHISLDGAGLPGGPGARPATLQRLGPGADLGRDRRGQDREPGRQPPVQGGPRVGPGQAPALPTGCCRPHQGQVPAGWAQRNSRQARHSPLVSLVRSPQSRQAPVTSRDFA